jgi:hypothetical protein
VAIFSRPLTSEEKELLLKQSRNTRFQAPIPLLTEEDPANHPTEIKVKVKRNPNDPKSGTYEKVYHTYSGSTTEGYCKFREDALTDYISQTASTEPIAKFNAADHLLEGTLKTNWTQIRQKYKENPTEANFVEALEHLVLMFCDSRAWRQQKRFMRRLGRPRAMTISAFNSHLETMNWYINYLPGTGDPLGEEEMRIALIEAQPDWMKTVMEEANYEWDDLEKHSKQEVLQYLGRLSLIQASIDDAKNKSKNKFKNNRNKGKPPEKKKTSTITHCNYCNKNFHTEEQCRKKKRDEQQKKPRKTVKTRKKKS